MQNRSMSNISTGEMRGTVNCGEYLGEGMFWNCKNLPKAPFESRWAVLSSDHHHQYHVRYPQPVSTWSVLQRNTNHDSPVVGSTRSIPRDGKDTLPTSTIDELASSLQNEILNNLDDRSKEIHYYGASRIWLTIDAYRGCFGSCMG